MNARQRLFVILATSAGLLALSVLIWALIKYPTEQFGGQRLVSDEVPILPVVGVYFKPITLIVIFGFVSWGSALEALRDYGPRLPLTANRLLFVLFGLVAFVFAYEVLWNFFMWAAAHAISPGAPVDFLSNDLNPSMTEGKDFAYVTKVDSLYVAVSLCSMFFLHTATKGKNESLG